MLVGQFPTLELGLVHKVIAFYLEHRDQVDQYVVQYQDELDRFRASGQARAECDRAEKEEISGRIRFALFLEQGTQRSTVVRGIS